MIFYHWFHVLLNFLVATIFNDRGQADYYLPHGRWTHLLSEESRDGGCWYHDQYDYFSLPLYVRENTILPLGKNDSRPDYDYLDQLELHIYALKDKASCRVANINGEYECTITAEKRDGKIKVIVSKYVDSLSVFLHSMEPLDICIEQITSSGQTVPAGWSCLS